MNETDALPSSLGRHVDHMCDCFEFSWKAWQTGERPRIADFVGATREPERSVLLRELIQLEVHYRGGRGEAWSVDEFQKHLPETDGEWLADLAARSVTTAPNVLGAETAVTHSCPTIAEGPSGVGNLRFSGYEILETIRSGMAVVCKARQERPHRLVALKTMVPRPGAMRAESLRFLHREAEHVAQLDHPNIVPVYEVGVSDGRPYFSMKWIDGGSLAQAIASGRWPTRERDSFRRAAQLMAMVARAIHYAHQHGILHRDLKPANILLDSAEHPLVSDFGLACSLDDIDLTSTGEIAGTPCYMSPEQASGKGLTTKVDVYGLGAILYELLTGRPPVRGSSSADTLRQVIDGKTEPPTAINSATPPDLEIICLKCLAKDPERRYDSAEAVADDLQRWLAGEPIHARRSNVCERALKWARRRPVAAALVAVSLILGILIFGLVVWQWRAVVGELEAAEGRKKAERVKDAAMLTLMVAESQKLYADLVVDRVKGSGVQVSHDYSLKPGTIPLPPSLTMALAKEISMKSSGTVRLYSDFPFPSRKDQPPLDGFEKEALNKLRQKPSEPFYRFENWQGRPSVRYASADVMRKQCVECHNRHEESPKKDWREGDVRGVLEVILPVD